MGSVRHKDVPEASSCFEAVPQFQGSLPHPTPFSYTVLLALRSLSCARSMICRVLPMISSVRRASSRARRVVSRDGRIISRA